VFHDQLRAEATRTTKNRKLLEGAEYFEDLCNAILYEESLSAPSSIVYRPTKKGS